jgi:tRNA G37 N-methylase Trm5
LKVLKNSLELSHEYIKKVVKQGDIAVDATAGNGNDTLLLARLVGSTGKVYSFDIQEKAIIKTKEKLVHNDMDRRVKLIKDGHQNMGLYIKEKSIKAVMFNLGYLPGGDHSIATRAETTIPAIETAMGLIVQKGIITIVVYYGGDSGFDEKIRLLDYIESIDSKKFTVMKTEFVNQINCPPILIVIEKIPLK